MVCLIALFIAMITDLKIREVPDWLNFSLIFAGIGINLIASVIYSNLSFIVNSVAGLAFAVAVALLMFYGGQWGGGDSKMIMGLGALLGINIYHLNITRLFSSFFISFFVNMLLVGSVFGLIWISVLFFKHRKKVFKRFKQLRHEKIFLRIRWVFLFLLISIIMLMFLNLGKIKYYFIGIILISFFVSYLWIFVKAIEETAMMKKVDVNKLTEGDWIVKDVKINGKKIVGPKDLGINKKQIAKLKEYKAKGKIKKVLIKEGIPFIPSFFLAFILTLMFGNLLTLIFL